MMSRHLVVVGAGLLAAACGPGLREFLLGPSRVPETMTTAAVMAPPTPSPAPSPVEPSAMPAPTPPDDGDFPENDAPVVRVNARVYFVECGGVEVPGSEDATEAPVGCRLHMDCTPRDAANEPTRAAGEPRWQLSDPGLVAGGNLSDYAPVFTIKREGVLTLAVAIDGVRSNSVAVVLK